MNKKYKIIIEEVISEQFFIEAASKDEAIKTTIQKYKSGEYVLSPGNLEQTKIAIVEGGQCNEWVTI